MKTRHSPTGPGPEPKTAPRLEGAVNSGKEVPTRVTKHVAKVTDLTTARCAQSKEIRITEANFRRRRLVVQAAEDLVSVLLLCEAAQSLLLPISKEGG